MKWQHVRKVSDTLLVIGVESLTSPVLVFMHLMHVESTSQGSAFCL